MADTEVAERLRWSVSLQYEDHSDINVGKLQESVQAFVRYCGFVDALAGVPTAEQKDRTPTPGQAPEQRPYWRNRWD